MRTLRLIAAATALITLGCGGDDNPTNPGDGNGNGATVGVVNNDFEPSTVTVPVNSTVTWQWNSSGTTHNVHFTDGTVSQNLASGTFLRAFSVPGTYNYVCDFHVSEGMTGTVTVTATSTGGTGNGGTGGGGGSYP
jgi:plastocyanin